MRANDDQINAKVLSDVQDAPTGGPRLDEPILGADPDALSEQVHLSGSGLDQLFLEIGVLRN
jgi:hypothetical protein